VAGIDLSSLIKPAEAQEPVANVTDLVMIGAESNIRQIIELSSHVPVLIEFHSTGANSLAQKLEASVRRQNGKIILVRIDGQLNPDLAAAFKVEQVPVVLALLKGQPVPLFDGDIESAEVERFVAKLLDAAASNGLKGFVTIGEGAPVNPVMEKAYEAIASGNLDAAKKIYSEALAENPRDLEFNAGLAQVNLMIRTIDLPVSLLEDPTTPANVRADLLATLGEFEACFAVLLAEFEASKSDQIKAQLLELFEVGGLTSPEVVTARKSLTNLLY